MPSKIEREVKELLDNLDYFLPPEEPDKPSPKGDFLRSPLKSLQRRFSLGQLVLGGLLFTIIAYFSLFVVPSVPILGIPGLALLLTALVFLLRPGPGRSYRPTEGRRGLGLSPKMGQALWERMRRRMRGRV